LTAAFELKKKTGDRHEIVVLDPRPDFTFIPSLIWLPFGGRQAKDVTFPLAPIYARKGIRFINEAAEKIDPAAHTVTTTSGEELSYDRLFIGTGPRLAFEKVPGLGPHDGHTQSVCNLEHALLARVEPRNRRLVHGARNLHRGRVLARPGADDGGRGVERRHLVGRDAVAVPVEQELLLHVGDGRASDADADVVHRNGLTGAVSAPRLVDQMVERVPVAGGERRSEEHRLRVVDCIDDGVDEYCLGVHHAERSRREVDDRCAADGIDRWRTASTRTRAV